MVLGVVGLVIVVVAVLGSSTYFALSYFLSQRLDQQLSSIANPSQIAIQVNAASTQVPSALNSPQLVWLTELNPDGTVYAVIGNYGSLRNLSLNAHDRSVLARKPGDPRTVTT
ncbi:MAG: hypothetical protein JWO63_684, partial [Frankiales bacterium]|nr:hypothetical protein [Frankiales bacterium]